MATIGLVSLESARAQGNLVINGTFDAGMDGWTVTGSAYIWEPAKGNPGGCVNLFGNLINPASISQDINGLIIGDVYTVSGDYLGGYTSFGVFVDGESQYYTGSVYDWQTFSFNFTATSPTTTLILSYPNLGTGGYRIDNISIVAIPEPSSSCLLGLGVAGGLLFQRRKKGLQI